MTDQKTPPQPAWQMDACPRPNTMPRYWDVSELMSPLSPNGHHKEPVQIDPHMMEDNSGVTHPPLFDPFPEPNTMPAGWDVSEL